MLSTARAALLPLLAAGAIFIAPHTKSDPIAIYGIIDRVVMSPDTINPRTIQVWGVFSLTDHAMGDNYSQAGRGYLYFTADVNPPRTVRAEWADLKSLAGKGQTVGFGAKYSRTPLRLRCPTEVPANPDPYTTNIGVVRGFRSPTNKSASRIDADLKSGKAPTVACRSDSK